MPLKVFPIICLCIGKPCTFFTHALHEWAGPHALSNVATFPNLLQIAIKVELYGPKVHYISQWILFNFEIWHHECLPYVTIVRILQCLSPTHYMSAHDNACTLMWWLNPIYYKLAIRVYALHDPTMHITIICACIFFFFFSCLVCLLDIIKFAAVLCKISRLKIANSNMHLALFMKHYF